MGLKILILLFYYNRPRIVRGALQSIQESTYKNWELAFIDDASDSPGEPIVREMFSDEELSKTKFYWTEDKETKLERGISIYGSVANRAIMETDSDLGIMLCDDDRLYPDYLGNLDKYFSENPDRVYDYSHVIPFNPSILDYHQAQPSPCNLNRTEEINPFCQVDASQVAWRLACNKEGEVWFPSPQTINLDAALYAKLVKQYGPCRYTGFIAQYKAFFEGQLGNRRNEAVFNYID